jgi:transcriptional regulator with XRE-family HTH domain
MDTFALRIRILRKEKGVTGAELAKAIGVNKATISKYENGIQDSPTLPILQSLADYFDVSIDYIAGISNIREKGITATTLSEIFKLLNDENKIKLVSYARFLNNEQENNNG